MTDETVQPEVVNQSVESDLANAPAAPVSGPTQEVAEAVADVADESFFQRVEKAVEELGASAHNLADWIRQEIAKVRS